MWKYVKRYLSYAVLAAAFMVGEVLMDLLQPELMSRIADDGVLGVHTGGVGDMSLILALGLKMTCLVLFGGLCGSLNNAFVHMTGQNVGNDIRKDAFRRLMTFSFPQVDCFGTGSLVTRMTNDITQVQNLVSQFVRGMIRTGMLMFGSIFFLFRLNTRFGLIALCAFPLIVGCMGLCLTKANPLFTRLQAQLDEINAILQEDISGIRVIKACIREGYEKKLRFGKANGALVCTQLQVLTILAFMNPIINILIYVVVALILRVGTFEVAEGTVLVDGVDVREYTLQALRNKVSIALQKAELFHQSIAQNIAWGREGADSESIRAAAQAAQAEEFITGTADGYATTVAACGSHEELLQSCKVYRDIYDSQMGKEELHA